MALRFAHGLAHDVIVSAADADRKADAAGDDWVLRFAEAFKQRAEFLSRKSIDIVQSPDDGAAVLILIVSPSYITSTDCQHHRESFLTTQAGSGASGPPRIIRVDKAPLPDGSVIPPDVAGLTRHQFYRLDHAGSYREFALDSAETAADESAAVDDVARRAVEMLAALEAQSAAPVAMPRSDVAVHLALATGDIDPQYCELRRWLEQTGYQVSTGQVKSQDAAGFRSEVSAALTVSQIAVFPVGRLYGWQPENGDGKSFMSLQLEEAANYANVRRIVWIPKGLDRVEPSQEKVIADIRRLFPVHGFEILEVPFQQLVMHLKALGKKASTPAPPPVPPAEGDVGAADGDLLHVYLMCDKCDRDLIHPYRQFLHKEGVWVDLLPESPDSGTIHRDWLVEDHGFLIYYATSDDTWYVRQRQELRKAKGYGRKSRVRSLTLLDPPPSRDKDDLRVIRGSVLDGLPPKELPEKLKELLVFIDDLKRDRGEALAAS